MSGIIKRLMESECDLFSSFKDYGIIIVGDGSGSYFIDSYLYPSVEDAWESGIEVIRDYGFEPINVEEYRGGDAVAVLGELRQVLNLVGSGRVACCASDYLIILIFAVWAVKNGHVHGARRVRAIGRDGAEITAIHIVPQVRDEEFALFTRQVAEAMGLVEGP